LGVGRGRGRRGGERNTRFALHQQCSATHHTIAKNNTSLPTPHNQTNTAPACARACMRCGSRAP
jgi:hypothetical protein